MFSPANYSPLSPTIPVHFINPSNHSNLNILITLMNSFISSSVVKLCFISAFETKTQCIPGVQSISHVAIVYPIHRKTSVFEILRIIDN